METLSKCAALAVAAALMNLAVRRGGGEFAVLLGAGAIAMIGVLALELLRPVMTFAEHLRSRADISAGLLSPVLKTLAIGYLTEVGGQICKDAGENAVAGALQIAGTAAAFYALLPLMESVLELLEGLL